MKFIVSSGEEETVVSTDGITVEVFGSGPVFDVVRSIVYKRELTHKSEVNNFPSEYLIKNDKGITEINTSSIDYLKEYLPKLTKPFGLKVTMVHE